MLVGVDVTWGGFCAVNPATAYLSNYCREYWNNVYKMGQDVPIVAPVATAAEKLTNAPNELQEYIKSLDVASVATDTAKKVVGDIEWGTIALVGGAAVLAIVLMKRL